MARALVPRRPSDGPGIDRIITLTDAVVAIAMTLLVLPLVEVSGDVDPHRLGAMVVDHRDLLLSFGVSFLVIYVFWAAHGGALRRLAGSGEDLRGFRALNMGWLLVIAFMPFPTAVLGREVNTATAPFYIGTMVVLSALTSAIGTVIDRSPVRRGRAAWAWATTAVFAGCAVVSFFNADLGMFGLLLLVVVRLLETRWIHTAVPAATADSVPGGGDSTPSPGV